MIPKPEQLETISRVTGGSLTEIPFAVLLHAMAVRRRSAVVELERKPVKKTAILEKGVPVDCRSNLLHETLGQVLVARGDITEEQRQRCLNKSASSERKLGETLIAHGLITPSELYKVLQQMLAKKLLHIFSWRSGTFRVLPEPDSVESPFQLRTPQLVVTGVTRFALEEEVQAALAPWSKSKLFLNPEPPYPLEEIRLAPEQQELIGRLRGGRYLEELAVETGQGRDALTRLLYALALINVVIPEEWLNKGVKTRGPDDTSRFTIARPTPQPTKDHRPTAATGTEFEDTMPLKVAAWTSAPPAERKRDPEAVSNEVMEAYLRYRKQDAFDLLGVDENASPTAVEQGYIEFSRKYAPWKFMMPELSHLLDKVQDLFLAGGRAFGELSDPGRRTRLIVRRRRILEEKRKATLARAVLRKAFLDSELHFRKGRALMRRGMYKEALRQLELAGDCDPENSKYRAEHAYCRFLGSPSVADKCLVELSETLRIDPKCGLAVYYSGLIERELGHRAQADVLIRKALKMMIPDRRPIDALRAIKSLRQANQKESKGAPVS